MREFQKIFVIGGLIVLVASAALSFYLIDPESFKNLFAADLFSARRMQELGPLALFFILAVSTFFSEDLACLTAGTLAAQGRINLALAIFACFLGIFIGDVLLFLLGRLGGTAVLKFRFVERFVTEKTLQKAARFLEKYGIWAIFLSRFTPGLRLPTYVLAGVLQTSFWKFTLFFFLATAFWTPILVGGSAWLGEEFFEIPFFEDNFWLGLIVFVSALFLIVKIGSKLTTWRNRRVFWGQINRRFYWEFWSLRVFYAPVFFYVLRLAVKHKSLTIFTAANPSIYAGGFVGESKTEILRGLRKSASARPHLLEFIKLDADLPNRANLELARRFIESQNLRFPVAVKPDVGERGAGAGFARDFAELEKKISEAESDLIVQEFAEGSEFSVFYYRFPASEKGEIFSITEKKFPEVTGDGASTLEELILRDERAVCLARSYLEQNEEDLEIVLPEGAKRKIIDIGTHSRGAIFLDGERFKTPALERSIDEICQGYEGFYFGRFDLRVRSNEDFERGENFKIIELNGVTSESTNIYDPKISLFAAYGILFRQWRIAFEIGAENSRRGIKPVSFSELLALTFRNFRRKTPKKTSENPKIPVEQIEN